MIEISLRLGTWHLFHCWDPSGNRFRLISSLQLMSFASESRVRFCTEVVTLGPWQYPQQHFLIRRITLQAQREAQCHISSTALHSFRAAQSRVDLQPQTAWCLTDHSSVCRLRLGTSECPRNSSSTSRRDSASLCPWTV